MTINLIFFKLILIHTYLSPFYLGLFLRYGAHKKISFIHSFLFLRPLLALLLLISKKKLDFLRFIGYLYSGRCWLRLFCHFIEKMFYSIKEKIWLIFWNNLFSRSKLRKKKSKQKCNSCFLEWRIEFYRKFSSFDKSWFY